MKTGFSLLMAKHPKIGNWLRHKINDCVDAYPNRLWSRLFMWYCLPRSAKSLSCQIANEAKPAKAPGAKRAAVIRAAPSLWAPAGR